MSVFDIAFEDLEDLKFFNKGNFGCLYRAQYFGTDVAVKKLLDIENKAMHKYIEREMCLLKTMRHPNIVQFMGMSKTDEDVYIITEYVNGGDLYDKLRDPNVQLSWKVRIRLAIETCRAIAYLHSRSVVHRDLKSQNLLVDDNWKVKICDFGFARAADSKEFMTLCGTDEWMAPEIMLGEKYDERADIYSFGMILTELIRRDDPPPRVAGAAFRFDEETFRRSVPADCPQELVECAIDCTKFYPEERANIKTILQRLNDLLLTVADDDFSNKNLAEEMTYMSIEGSDERKRKRKSTKHKKRDSEKDPGGEKKDKDKKKKRKETTESDSPVSAEKDKEKKKKRSKDRKKEDKKRDEVSSSTSTTNNNNSNSSSAEKKKRKRSSSSKKLKDVLTSKPATTE